VEIARLIPCENVVLQVMNFGQHRHVFQRSVTSPMPDDEEGSDLRALFWAGFWGSKCSHPQRTGDTSIMWNGYQPPPLQTGGEPMVEYMSLMGWCDEVLVPLPSPDADDHRLLLFRREGPAFTERDILVLGFVQSAVAERHSRHLHRVSVSAGLTPRQVEILRLVAEGCTNRQIARALTISEATARTHLANIYSRLGATNRTQALAAAGLLLA
jgi:DNA-binding CsgD family transcriptional regulator